MSGVSPNGVPAENAMSDGGKKKIDEVGEVWACEIV